MDVLEPSSQQKRLDSWKEIGAFFGRDERTVKRWERERKLPVHRVPGSGRGRVFAYAAELEQWLTSEEAAVAASPEETSLTPIPPEPSTPAPGPVATTSGALAYSVDPVPRTAKLLELPQLSLVERPAAAAAAAEPPALPPPVAPAPVFPSPGVAPAVPRSRLTLIYVLVAIVLLGCVAAAMVLRSRARTAAAVAAGAAKAKDPQAEQLYLKGVYYWQKRTPDSLHRAVDAFTQAIVHDPAYAPAYAGLAECYDLLREYDTMPGSEAYPRAVEAARRAIALDPNSAVGHRALAFALYFGEGNTAAAEQEFQTALRLDPNSATTHHWYGTYPLTIGDKQRALEQLDIAQKLDPSSRAILADKGILLSQLGRTDEAKHLLQDLEKSDPDFLSPHAYLAAIAAHTGDDAAFIAELKEVARLTGDPDKLALTQAAEKGLASGGHAGMVNAVYARLEQQHQAGRTGPAEVAYWAALSGKQSDAVRLWQEAIARKDSTPKAVMAGASEFGLQNDAGLSQIRAQAK